MSDLPAPLVLEFVDLRDYQFLPLDVVRLRDSDLAALESAEAFRAAVLLWCASWHQVPAASLPDDDRVLANLAGYGRVVSEWQKVRPGAMRGWIACSDGRLYHPVVAEKAIEGWDKKVEQRYRNECSRIRKNNTRHGVDDPIPNFDTWFVSWTGYPCPKDRPSLSNGQTAPVRETGAGQEGSVLKLSAGTEGLKGRTTALRDSKETGTVKGQGQRYTYSEARAQQGNGRALTGSNREGAPRETDTDWQAWEATKAAYPDFTGRRDWISAQHYAQVLVDTKQATWPELLAAVQRYAAFVAAGGVSGPQYVLTPAKFFSAKDRPWSQAWDPPNTREKKKLWEPPPDEPEEVAHA